VQYEGMIHHQGEQKKFNERLFELNTPAAQLGLVFFWEVWVFFLFWVGGWGQYYPEV